MTETLVPIEACDEGTGNCAFAPVQDGTSCSGGICQSGACIVAVTDADGDGADITIDCNDNDATKFPGQTWYPDCDGDSAYSDTSVIACDNPSIPCVDGLAPDGGWINVVSVSDCNDEDPLSYPGNAEICDGIDNNCDGVVDEGCSCSPANLGELRECQNTNSSGSCTGTEEMHRSWMVGVCSSNTGPRDLRRYRQ